MHEPKLTAPELDHHPAALPCPLCRRPIAAGDSAGLHGGRILHLDCYIAVVHADNRLLAYLKRRVDQAFCTTCLVSANSVTFEEAALAHAWLRARAGVRAEVAACSACGGRRVTLVFKALRAVAVR